MKIVKCRSCKANIFYIKYKGKAHPINAMPRKVFVPVGENKFGSVSSWELMYGYESHFATCPDAAKWRKKK